jgi:hypothetical protein
MGAGVRATVARSSRVPGRGSLVRDDEPARARAARVHHAAPVTRPGRSSPVHAGAGIVR